MPILTPRLMLRPLQEGDGAVIHAAKQESWDELARWNIWTFKPKAETTLEDDESWCTYKRERFENRQDVGTLAFDRQNGQLIGAGGLNNCEWKSRIFTLGYWVRTDETGKGYASELSAALLHYAFGALEANKVKSFHAAGNLASGRVLQKSGFTYEGTLRRQHLLDEGLVDEVYYGILRGEALPALDVQW